MEVAGLAKFTAYCNKAIKVVFDDRTIVRMVYGCDSIRLLTRLGEELLLNLKSPSVATQAMLQNYANYIRVAEEFFEWAFSSLEERQMRELEAT